MSDEELHKFIDPVLEMLRSDNPAKFRAILLYRTTRGFKSLYMIQIDVIY